LAFFLFSVFSLSHLTQSVLGILIIALGIYLKRREEYQCDEFAATTIANEYSMEGKPSDILKITLKSLPYSIMSAIIHPSHENRIKNILAQKLY
jgi:Zn-dependent protease with chaperone function